MLCCASWSLQEVAMYTAHVHSDHVDMPISGYEQALLTITVPRVGLDCRPTTHGRGNAGCRGRNTPPELAFPNQMCTQGTYLKNELKKLVLASGSLQLQSFGNLRQDD